MGFWVIAGLMAAMVAFLLALVLIRTRADGIAARAYDLGVYRDQLREVDKDRARGLLSAEDAERTRIEISRRILELDREEAREGADAAARPGQPEGLTRAMAVVVALAVLAGGVGTYVAVGAPGKEDQPLVMRLAELEEQRRTRMSQSEAEAQLGPEPERREGFSDEYLDLVAQLRERMRAFPDDLEGNRLLVRHEAGLGRFAAARQAQERVVSLLGPDMRASDLSDLAELMILATRGYVSPQAEGVLAMALALEPRDGRARYYTGLMLAQTGRPAQAYNMWVALARDSRPDAPWMPPIREQIPGVAMMAGLRFEPGDLVPARTPDASAAPGPVQDEAAQSGPTPEQMAAAAEMEEEEREAMVRGMVDGLAARLADEGGTAADWARLIMALSVLGEEERATTILAEARTHFAADARSMEVLDAASREAGLAE
ncbi:MAG: c-type cytochrome biogenesis protein CcmI [Rhodobacteraceae bacterium]|nr:c-type cytochrome biogenesis protein CcmI [Paracoccaceae bacterium]